MGFQELVPHISVMKGGLSRAGVANDRKNTGFLSRMLDFKVKFSGIQIWGTH